MKKSVKELAKKAGFIFWADEEWIKDMKAMFASGKIFKLDWWPDTTKDTNPNNPYYK